jgi:GntR family transcriptional regulator
VSAAQPLPINATREPKFYPLKRYLEELTLTLPTGAPIPPERLLATDFATSRTTVRQAVHALIVEGRLERIHGKGTFVARPKMAQPLTLTSYTEDMRARGIEPSSVVLSIETVDAGDDLASRLNIDSDSAVIVIERLRLANGEPMAVERSHVPQQRFPGLTTHFQATASLYAVLRDAYSVTPASAEQTIETSLATPVEAALLGIDTGVPVMLLSRNTYDELGQPFEWVRAVYRGDRYTFVAHLTRPANATLGG